MTSPHPTSIIFDTGKRRPARRALARKLGLMGLKLRCWARKSPQGVRGKSRDTKGLLVSLGLTGLTGLKFPPPRIRARGERAERGRKCTYALRSNFQARQARQAQIRVYPSDFITFLLRPSFLFSSPTFPFQAHQAQRERNRNQHEAVK